MTYLGLQKWLIWAASPAEEKEDEEEGEEDVEHDDQREQGVGYEGETAVPVVRGNRVVPPLQSGQGDVVDEGVL